MHHPSTSSVSPYTTPRHRPDVAPHPTLVRAERPPRPVAMPLVPRAHPAVAALPVLGAAVGAVMLLDYGDQVLLPVRSLVVLGGAVLGAWLSLSLIRWEPDERDPLRR